MMFLTGWSSLRELYGDVTCIFCKGLGCRGKEFGRKSRNASSVRLAIDLDSSWLTKLMDIRKCLVVGRQRALWLLSLVVSAAEMDQQRSSHVLGHAREPRCRRGDGNGLPSASSVFGCWLEEEGNGWDCEREREERGPVISAAATTTGNSAGMERTPTSRPLLRACRCSFAIAFLTPARIVSFFVCLSPFVFCWFICLCAYPPATVFIVTSSYINDRPRWVYSSRLEGSAIMKGTNYKYCCEIG